MSTNLLTTYITNKNKPVIPQQNPQDITIVNVEKKKPDFDINKELTNRTFIKPLPPKAKLIKSSISDAPAIFVKDTLYNIKSLKDGFKGNANDHQLGKINDLGMRFGGLAIAAYLFTRRQTPTAKIMEFIGLGSFFASMALWPKLALQLPAKLIHGFNIMPQYEDSYGRKKPFYQDNLFIPWDLYSDEEINKIGNRLHVPKDIPNRREFIQEKMRKIALQNNTMWMLTAGFATPIMSSLICNALEKPVTNAVDFFQNKYSDDLLAHFAQHAKFAKDKSISKSVESLIELHKDHTVNKKMIREFAFAIGGKRDFKTVMAIEKDLNTLLLNNSSREYLISTDTIKNLVNASKNALSDRFSTSIINSIIPSENQVIDFFQSDKTKLRMGGGEVINAVFNEDKLEELSSAFDDLIREQMKKYTEAGNSLSSTEKSIILNKINGKEAKSGVAYKEFLKAPQNKLNTEIIQFIRRLTKIMTDFTAEGKILNKYAAIKFGETSNLANYWNRVDKSILKVLNFSDEELQLIKNDEKITKKLLNEKLEKIASDETLYKDVLNKLFRKMSSINNTIIDNQVPEEYKSLVDTVYTSAADKLKGLTISAEQGEPKRVSMSSLIKELVGFDDMQRMQNIDKKLKIFSQKDIQKSYTEGRLLSVNSSFQRLINTLDYYRRIATGQNIKVKYPIEGFSEMPLEIMEELIDASKNILLDSHMGDFENKFIVLRNPNPDLSSGSLKFENGKLIFQKINTPGVKKIEIPNDKIFFQNLVDLMFGNKMHPDTQKIADENQIINMDEYRRAMKKDVCDAEYFAKMYHRVTGEYGAYSKATSENKFFRIGKSLTDMVWDTAKETFHTKKWLKMFGGFGLGLLGVTVLSQFFFGRMPNPKTDKKG